MASQVIARGLRTGLEPLRFRGYRLLFAGEAISEFGNAFHYVALPWIVYHLGGDTRQLGFVLAGYGGCRLAATPLGGVCTDRVGAWRGMMTSDIARITLT